MSQKGEHLISAEEAIIIGIIYTKTDCKHIAA